MKPVWPALLPGELVIDSFAGGGGTSEGIRLALGRDPDIAVNHDALALAMHRVNHPGTHHIVEDGEPVRAVDDPLHTVTAKPRHGLVTVTLSGEAYVITDIGMRMLTPRERFSLQGFRPTYIITYGIREDGTRVEFTLEQQGRMCGNSVCPGLARALVAANAGGRRRRATPRRLSVPLSKRRSERL